MDDFLKSVVEIGFPLFLALGAGALLCFVIKLLFDDFESKTKILVDAITSLENHIKAINVDLVNIKEVVSITVGSKSNKNKSRKK